MSLYITTSDFSAVPWVLPALQADFMDLTELIHFQSSGMLVAPHLMDEEKVLIFRGKTEERRLQ